MKQALLSILFCYTCSLAAAQQNKPGAGFGIEANFMAGKVLKHSEKFRAPVPELSTAAEVNFVQQTDGRPPGSWFRNSMR